MKSTRKKFKFIVEKTDTGFSAFSTQRAVYTTGKSIIELQSNILEALQLALADENIRVDEKNIDIEIDLKQFFRYYRVLNSKFLAERIGMNPTLFSQYVQGRKKPSASQTNKILIGIHQIGKELLQIRLAAN